MNKLGIIDLCSVFGKVEADNFGHDKHVFSVDDAMVLLQNRIEPFVRDYKSSVNRKLFCGRSFRKLINTSTASVLFSNRIAHQVRKQRTI